MQWLYVQLFAEVNRRYGGDILKLEAVSLDYMARFLDFSLKSMVQFDRS